MSCLSIYTRPTDRITAGSWTVATGTPRSGYPVTALDDGDPSAPFWISGTTASVVRNFGSALRVDEVDIFAHTFVNAAVVKVQMHTADSWATPDVSVTLTIPAAYGDGFSYNLRADIAAAYPTVGDRTKQYLRITNTVANTVTVAIGEVWISPVQRTFSREFVMAGLIPQDVTHLVAISASKRGVKTTYDYGSKERRFRASLLATEADYFDLLALREDAHGVARSFVFSHHPNSSTSRYAEPLMVRLLDVRVGPAFDGNGFIPVTLDLEELGRGEIVGA